MGASHQTDVVITGLGTVSPLGIGHDRLWRAMLAGDSGVRAIDSFDTSGLPVKIAGQVLDFDPKAHVRPRKSLKVMARDTQFGVTAAELACIDSGLTPAKVDPDRFGVVFGADVIASEMTDETMESYRACFVDGEFDFSQWGPKGMSCAFPLAFLRILPNMIPSHIAIAQDARGPNNTLHQGEVSSLLAIDEAAQVIRRGWADVMIAGGASSRMQPFDLMRACLLEEMSRERHCPASACRPFDAARGGQVRGEGAAAFILESRRHAEARRARILVRIAGSASAYEPRLAGKPFCGCGIARSMRSALRQARLEPADLGHVNAHGLGTRHEDRIEAAAIREVCGDVPVTAPKSCFGNLGAAAGAMELAVSLLSVVHGSVPPTLNCSRPDPECPVNLVTGRPLACPKPAALLTNMTTAGQSAALVIVGE